MPAKVGIKSCRCAKGCISFVYGCSYPAAIVFDQTYVHNIQQFNCLVFIGNVNASDGTTQLEEKRGQFLGSTLKSTGDTFLVIS